MGDTATAHYLREFIRIAVAQGYDADQLLRGAGIDARVDTLGRATCSVEQCRRFYQQLVERMGDVCLGVHGYRYRVPLSHVRVFFAYVVQGRNLGAAIELAIEFFALCDQHLRAGLPGSPVQISSALKREPRRGLVSYEINAVKDRHTVASDLHDIASLHRLFSHLIGMHLELQAVRIMAPADAPPDDYQALLNCPIEFGQTGNALVFAVKYLDYPLRQTGESLRALLDAKPYELLFPRPTAGDDALDVVTRAKHLIGGNFQQQVPDAEQLAALLGLSPRRLRWLLEKQGTSYRQLKDDCLRAAAINYLQRPELSVAAIAERLGFADAGAFNRTFKRMTGLPPGAYRSQQIKP